MIKLQIEKQQTCRYKKEQIVERESSKLQMAESANWNPQLKLLNVAIPDLS
jgi:hypothetical protein